MRGQYKKPAYALFNHKHGRCILLSSPDAKEGMERLGKWFMEEERVPLDAAKKVRSTGNVWNSLTGHVIKHGPKKMALHEFLVALRAEELTEVTPREPVLLLSEKDGYLSTRLIEGLPLGLLLDAGISHSDAVALSCGIFSALGQLHYGNGVFGVLHGDMDSVNNLVSAGAPADGGVARVMFVDLAKAKIIRHSGDFGDFAAEMSTLSFNLLLCGMMGDKVAAESLEHYLRANPLADRAMAEGAIGEACSIPLSGKGAESG
jgi:hypothetical protein